MRHFLLLILFFGFSTSFNLAEKYSYKVLNSELGIVYLSPSVKWDSQQWEAMFRDPSPPAGWAMIAVGPEACNDIPASWISNARRKGLNIGLVVDARLTPNEIEKVVRCSATLGFRRVIVDEYITFNVVEGRPVCEVISEMRDLSQRVKRNYPTVQFGIDENWHIWMERLKQGQSTNCGSYPFFKVDYPGVSVYTKYGNPSGGVCGHPTAAEMEEQTIDLNAFIKDYSRSGKVFAWQLNQNWYPGGENTLQFFRRMKTIYGWDRFFLYGPTNGNDVEENWAYSVRGVKQQCPGIGYEWYLPARQYLIRMSEGQKPFMTLSGPTSAAKYSEVSLNGKISSGSGLQTNGIELQYIPPAGSPQSFTRQLTAPSGSLFALVGMRVNTQLPNPIKEPVHFSVQRAQLFDEGSNNNLVSSGEFNNGTGGWIVLSNTPVRSVTSGSEKSIEVEANVNQTAQIISSPIRVHGGRNYIVNFDARIFRESRNGAYFFVSWNKIDELRKDRIFMTGPPRQTLIATSSSNDGRFQFSFIPTEIGLYHLFAFFDGGRSLQPAQTTINLNVN